MNTFKLLKKTKQYFIENKFYLNPLTIYNNLMKQFKN